MDLSSVRLIPNVLDKLFYYTVPADTIASQNAHVMLKPIACRQVRYRLATPKKGMLLLAWPFCMHASNFYKQMEFYITLRTNVLTRCGLRVRDFGMELYSSGEVSEFDSSVLARKKEVVEEKMHDFLSGYETFMLHCVQGNVNLYTQLNVLMLYFLPHEKHKEFKTDILESFQANHRILSLTSELWGNVIGDVVAQASTTLRHFVFCSNLTTLQLPDRFYTNLKLDCLLAQMQQLKTLYMPSMEKYEQAHSTLHVERPCWQALHDLPIEKRLPNLRRIVVLLPTHSGTKCAWVDSDVSLLVAAFSDNSNVNSCEPPPPTSVANIKAKFPHCSSPPALVIEVVGQTMCCKDDFARNFDFPKTPKNINCYFRPRRNVLKLYRITVPGFERDNFDSSRQSSSDIEKSLLDIITCRRRMNSVVNDVTNYCQPDRQQAALMVPAVLYLRVDVIAPEDAESMLRALSCNLSCPLSLMLQIDARFLFQHLALFTMPPPTTTTTMTATMNEKEATLQHWTTYFPRGVLKLHLTLDTGGVERYVAYRTKKPARISPGGLYFDFLCEKLLSVGDSTTRYVFPPAFTIEFCPPALEIGYGDNDNRSSIRTHFMKHTRQFVDEIIGDKPIILTDDEACMAVDAETLAAAHAATKRLRTDLYASCRKLVIVLEVSFDYDALLKLTESGTAHAVFREISFFHRIEKLMYEKQLEQKLIGLFCKPNTTAAKRKGVAEPPQFVMPNLSSISVVRKRVYPDLTE